MINSCNAIDDSSYSNGHHSKHQVNVREGKKSGIMTSAFVLLTQWLKFLHGLLPHRLYVDAGKAPIGGHFDEVGPLVAVWKDIAVKLSVVKKVLAVCKVPEPGQ